ncbi:hypothetical protein [Puerhibacterium puerhi]|uniref:hypothetical protein n=1 Tax=Puerhibacterium puerhi TaxID=2692623 RepID=UPI0013568B6D|nr:hypothetical protein [Puerhibacterium puerhi]
MKRLASALLVVVALVLGACAGFLALSAPPLSGGTGWAIVLLLVVLVLFLRARAIRVEQEKSR